MLGERTIVNLHQNVFGDKMQHKIEIILSDTLRNFAVLCFENDGHRELFGKTYKLWDNSVHSQISGSKQIVDYSRLPEISEYMFSGSLWASISSIRVPMFGRCSVLLYCGYQLMTEFNLTDVEKEKFHILCYPDDLQILANDLMADSQQFFHSPKFKHVILQNLSEEALTKAYLMGLNSSNLSDISYKKKLTLDTTNFIPVEHSAKFIMVDRVAK